MAYQVIAIYNHPESVEAFDAHYDGTHAPIVLSFPGLRGFTVTRPEADAAGPPPSYMLAVMTFDDAEAMKVAMSGAEGAAAVADMANFAGAGVTVVTGDTVVYR